MSQPSDVSLEDQGDRDGSPEPGTSRTDGQAGLPPEQPEEADIRGRFGNLKHGLTTHWTVQDR